MPARLDDLPAAAAFFAEALVRLRVRRSRVDFANGVRGRGHSGCGAVVIWSPPPASLARPTPSGGRMERHSRCRPAIAYERAADSRPSSVGRRGMVRRVCRRGSTVAGCGTARGRGGSDVRLLASSRPAGRSVSGPRTRTNRCGDRGCRCSPGASAMCSALLCQRLTDPEIAETLFLSPRTASNHVANILAKLGAPNRREAARSRRPSRTGPEHSQSPTPELSRFLSRSCSWQERAAGAC